jgi:hypothetical protein
MSDIAIDLTTAPAPPPVEPVRKSRSRRGVGAPAPQVPEEFIDPDTGEPYRRVSRADGNISDFDVPAKQRKKGWDYQWFTIRVMQADARDVDAGSMVAIHKGGWRPVTTDEMPGMMPANWATKLIEHNGQRLYKRPEYLSAEAKQEQTNRANEQMAARYESAGLAPPGTAPRHLTKVRTSIESVPQVLLDGGEMAEMEEIG